MIFARVCGRVSRAPVEHVRANGQRQATVGLTVNAAGEFVAVTGVAFGTAADGLLALCVGESVELSGPIQPKTHVDEGGVATVIFDLKVQQVARPQANWSNQA